MVAVAKRTKVRVCVVCHTKLPDGHEGCACAACRRAMDGMRLAHQGECDTPHPLLESRLIELEERRALGLSLFSGRVNDAD